MPKFLVSFSFMPFSLRILVPLSIYKDVTLYYDISGEILQ